MDGLPACRKILYIPERYEFESTSVLPRFIREQNTKSVLWLR